MSAKTYYLPTRIVTGRGSFQQVGDICASCGRKVLLVCGRHAAREGLVDRIQEMARSQGLELTVHAEAGREPTLSMVDEAVALLRATACDVVVGLGGGSAMDLAKAVAGLALLEGSTSGYFAGRPVDGASLPLVAVPTTAGTGAEVTKNAVLTDCASGAKASIRDDRWYPRWAVVDPELGITMPAPVTASSGSDALCQAIEAYTSIAATVVTDAMAERAIALIGGSLERAYRHGDDLSAREEMAYGSLLAGMALSNARLGAVHGMAHPLGATFNLPHGLVCGLLLPYTMAYNEPETAKYAQVARLLGVASRDMSDQELRRAAVERVKAIMRAVGIPARLGPLGVRVEDLDAIVQASLPSSSLKHNPRTLDAHDVRAILESAL